MRREVMDCGFLISKRTEGADFCIVNTCSVTALADKKSRQAIRKLKNENCKMKIVVIGCGANEADEMPEVDLAIPNKDKKNTVDKIIDKFQIKNDKSQISDKSQTAIKYRTRALLKVQDGCNNFCAYCIVPFLRGREVSVPLEEVISEAKSLDRLGYKELVISGVNVGKYQPVIPSGAEGSRAQISRQARNDKGNGLEKLLRKILKETSFPRIRLSSINPQDITDGLIDLWDSESRLARHFHLSLQSGSNTVLTRMGRPYTTQEYLDLVKMIYKKMPETAITTDIIVGFPGETDVEFEETCEFVKKAKLAKIHVFRYSNRSGTKASRMPEQLPDDIKKERAARLIRITEQLETKFKEKFIGEKMAVLFEEQKNNFWYGLTSNYIRVKYKSDEKLFNEIKEIPLAEENLA